MVLSAARIGNRARSCAPRSCFRCLRRSTSLPGAGPKLAEALERLAGPRVVDLLWHLPFGVIDRRPTRNIAAARAGAVATLIVRIGRHQPPLTPRQPYRVFCGDDSGSLVLVFFHARGDYLNRVLPVGSERIVSGTVDLFADSLQMTHPDFILDVRERDRLGAFEPVYPLTAGLNPRTLAKLHGGGAGARAGPARVARRRPCASGAAGRPGGRRWSRRTIRRTRRRCCRKRRRGCASPTTSCWPTSWRWP